MARHNPTPTQSNRSTLSRRGAAQRGCVIGMPAACRLGFSGNLESRSSMNSPERSPDSTWMLVFGCWLIASTSTLGALFFSEIMDLPPCVLCWYQRIFMFPLVLLLPVGLLPFDARVVSYALPLALAGWLVSLFQVLLVVGLIPEAIRPCTQGVPCSEVQIQWLGFVNIPLLSLIAFSTMNALLIAARIRSPR
jgi:disulfide bond formation protein DsbB